MAITVDKKGLTLFIDKWTGRGKEDEDDRSYWIDLFQKVFSQSDVTDRIDFQKKVIGPDGNTKRIDAYIPETSVIIEQKSLGIALDKPQAGHNGMTPYEQAKMYDNGLPRSEKARWIVTSNFEEIWVYDMEKRKPEEDIIKIYLSKLDKEYPMLQFLFDPQVEQIRRELKVSQEAGNRIGKVYDALLSLYPGEPTEEEYRSLNLFCVRLVFCYYAEDAGLFGKYQFRDYVASFNPKHLRNGLKDLFRILDTKDEDRDRTEEPELLDFPYVNGGLFADRNIIIPQIDEKTQAIMTETSDFNWAEISPTIFGAVFESTLNQETRRKGGMHYTSIENIHKVIDPLFLDELKDEYKTISESKQPNVKRQKLMDYQNKLGKLKFLDPACGSGNFLTETYLSLRRIENEVIKDIIELDKTVQDNQIALGELGSANSIIKVNLSQFYGIEINDFAVAVSKAALWIAESQMLKETESIVYHNINFLPLKSYINIIEGNALQVNWQDVINPSECSFIMGNPPFIGKKEQTAAQKKELIDTYGTKISGVGNMDYVTGWYVKAAEYMAGTSITTAFVSTNSITQGEQPPVLWTKLTQLQVNICFAYRTFVWDSEANEKAHVHCVIIGFRVGQCPRERFIYEDSSRIEARNINPYLTDAPTVLISNRSKPICNVPSMCYGSMPIDDNNLILDEQAVQEALRENPNNVRFIREYVGGDELLKGKKRWCLWLDGIDPTLFMKSKFIMGRIDANREYRLHKSTRPQTNKAAETPHLFGEIRQPRNGALVIPKVSSEDRDYIPISYVKPDIIINGSALLIPDADLYYFGVLSSSVHNAWMRTVAGRMKSDYQYSAGIVYNNFPWPTVNDKQRNDIATASQAILDAREKLTNATLADMYKRKNFILFTELKKAHDSLNKLVMEAYGMSYKDTTELSCVSELMKMYQKLTEEK